MNTQENNQLIAEFMGMQKTDIGWYDAEELMDLWYTTDNTFDELLFNKSWDWLMPVVDKIENIIIDEDNSFNVTIGSSIYCVIQDSKGECYDMTYEGEKSKILATYKAVVEFIKQYNK